jgi:hypothetical protein
VVFHCRVFLSTTGEIESEPTFDFIWLTGLFVAVVIIDFNDTAALGVVGACLVVENCVPVETDTMLFRELA